MAERGTPTMTEEARPSSLGSGLADAELAIDEQDAGRRAEADPETGREPQPIVEMEPEQTPPEKPLAADAPEAEEAEPATTDLTPGEVIAERTEPVPDESTAPESIATDELPTTDDVEQAGLVAEDPNTFDGGPGDVEEPVESDLTEDLTEPELLENAPVDDPAARPGAEDILPDEDDLPRGFEIEEDEGRTPDGVDPESGFTGPKTGQQGEDPFALDDDTDDLFGGRLDETAVPGGLDVDPDDLDHADYAPELDPVLEDSIENDDALSSTPGPDAPDTGTPDEMTGATTVQFTDGFNVIERDGLQSLLEADLEFRNKDGSVVAEFEIVAETEDGQNIYEDQETGALWTEDELELVSGVDLDDGFVEQTREFYEWAKGKLGGSNEDYGPDAPTGQGPEEIDPDDPNWKAKVAAKNGDIDGGEWDGGDLDESETGEYDGVDYGEGYQEPENIGEDPLEFNPLYDDPAVDPIELADEDAGFADMAELMIE